MCGSTRIYAALLLLLPIGSDDSTGPHEQEGGFVMKKLVGLSLMAVTLSATMAANANAWTRDSHYWGPRGQSSVHASGSCGGQSCSRSVTKTGPYGNSVDRSGSASCSDGSCSGSRTTTGPRGNSVTRSGTVSR
jgi:hypothetical protein